VCAAWTIALSPALGRAADCNGNGVPDDGDIAAGTSLDCNANVIPDECELDGDLDGVIDDCDGCPMDPAKTDPGACGCGHPDVDTDADGDPDCSATTLELIDQGGALIPGKA
jgi:hypothetical protein